MVSIKEEEKLVEILKKKKLITKEELAELNRIEAEIEVITRGIGTYVVKGALGEPSSKGFEKSSIMRLMELIREKKEFLADVIKRSGKGGKIFEEVF